MRIAVCVKQIIDPEIPASKFAIDQATKTQKKPGDVNLVIDSFSQNALEVALRIKDKHPDSVTITALSVGDESASATLKTALSMGANDAVLIADPLLRNAPPTHIAHALALAIKKLPPHNLILSGCVSGDWSDGIVGGFIAEILSMQFLACANLVETGENGMLKITRSGENGMEIWESCPPLSVSIISSPLNTPRYPKMKDIMAAGKKPQTRWTAADIGFDPNAIPPHAEKEDVRIASRETNCEIIPDGDPGEQAALLFAKLRERRAF